MTIAELATLADQSKPANGASLVDRYNDVYSRPDDIALAKADAQSAALRLPLRHR
jgi:hypothetical protein